MKMSYFSEKEVFTKVAHFHVLQLVELRNITGRNNEPVHRRNFEARDFWGRGLQTHLYPKLANFYILGNVEL